MFSQFGATSDTLSKASTMVFRIGTDAHLYDDPEDVNISPLLDSKFDSEKCEALKRLLALIAQGFDVSNYFPQVVKNVASQSFEVKKLVYVYLLHYAEKRPNEALLSINCFQKDLVDINPLVRAWALRTMAGIRLHVIAPIVLMAVGKCARDPSVYVRKCAANALPKLNDLRVDENASATEEIIGILLNDTSPGVVGAAASAFNSVCPSNLPLIGRSFRRLCEILPDVEEWGQIILIEILLRYLVAKHGLVKESIMYSACGTESCNSKDEASVINPTPDENGNIVDGICKPRIEKLVSISYIEAPHEYLSRSNCRYGNILLVDDGSFTSAECNEDVKLLLKCTSPLLWSNNSAVVLAAAGVHWIVAPKGDVERIVKPLLFVLRSSSASKYVVLCNIQVFAKAIPSLFAPYYEEFFISASDSYQVKALKLGILSGIATESSIPQIFMEFQDYIRDPDRRFAADTVAAIGLCAERLPSYANRCMEGLLSLTRQELKMRGIDNIDGEAGILIQAVLSIRAIVRQDAAAYEKVIVRLVRSLDSIKVPAVRAIIIWMVGEYSSTGKVLQKTSTIVLKYLVHCFTTEASETKLQILNTSAKVLLCANEEDMHTLRTSVCFLLDLAKSDMNYDVRDRARFFKNILTICLEAQGQDLKQTSLCKKSVHVLAEKIFGAQKFTISNEHSNDRFYLPGSLSLIVLHTAPGYEPLPKPCSLSLADHLSNEVQGAALTEDSYETDNSSISGSVDERSASSYSSQQSTIDSNSGRGSDDCSSASGDEENSHPLIHLDTADAEGVQSADTTQIMSKRALESWLTEEPSPSELVSSRNDQVYRSARISVFDIGHRVQPKSYTLLDTASGNGLKVDYSFSSESSSSPLLICLDVSFQNCSTEPLLQVILMEESDKGTNQASGTKERSSATEKDVPSILPMEEIEILEPGQMIKRLLQVRFNHHLLPLKLALRCNGQKYSVRLRPDIGYFVKPLPMDIEAFTSKESQLPGMFEYMRRCTFTDHVEDVTRDKSYRSFVKDVYLAICERLALKMLGNANLCLVSVDMPVDTKLDDASGLCLRFSCEILRNSVPCLITITVDGNCFEPLNLTVKVNCEETVFGLNLLNRIVSFLAESTSSQL